MDKKQDRRIRKTKSQLREGLAQLMKQKSIREITVKELVEKVDINRSTFYLHYTDIYDMLESIEAELVREIKEVIASHPEVNVENENTDYIRDILGVLDKNRMMCSVLLGKYGDMAFVYYMEEMIAEHSVRSFRASHAEMAEEYSYAYSFCLSGCVGMIKKWLKSDTGKSVEEMAKITEKLIRGVREEILT